MKLPNSLYSGAAPHPDLGECCVLMPFALDDVYETIMAAVTGGEICFHCTRADEFLRGGRVMSDILEAIARAEIVLADLTTANPNVMYELGIAHTVKDPQKVIIITQERLEDLPFDVKDLRVLRYDASDADGLKRALVKAFTQVGEFSWQFELADGETYEAEKKIFGLDRQHFYTFGLLRAEIGEGGAAFSLRVQRFESGTGWRELSSQRQPLEVGESVRMPALGWELKLLQSQGGKARFGVGRGDLARGTN